MPLIIEIEGFADGLDKTLKKEPTTNKMKSKKNTVVETIHLMEELSPGLETSSTYNDIELI